MLSLFKRLLAFSIFLTMQVGAVEQNEIRKQSIDFDAKFSTTKCQNPCQNSLKLDWWMMRRADLLEIRNFESGTGKLAPHGEIWQFSPQNKLSHLYLMHDDKRAIEYLYDDLKILGVPNTLNQWQFLSQLVTDQEINALNKSDQSSPDFQGLKTEAYTGKVKEVPVDVLWIPSLRIPAKIVYHHPKSIVMVSLNQLYYGGRLKESDAPITQAKYLDNYQRVSYVDIGDMEQDPEVQAWVAKAHGALGLSGHAHHHH